MLATVFIRDLSVSTIIGICDWEQNAEQVLRFDISMQADIGAAAKSDNVDDALNYADVSVFVESFVKGHNAKLLEGLLADLADALLSQYGVIDSIELTVRKPEAIEAAECAGITLVKVREE